MERSSKNFRKRQAFYVAGTPGATSFKFPPTQVPALRLVRSARIELSGNQQQCGIRHFRIISTVHKQRDRNTYRPDPISKIARSPSMRRNRTAGESLAGLPLSVTSSAELAGM